MSADGVAHRKDVLLGEVDVEVTVRVRRIGDVTVADPRIESGLVVEGLIRLGDFRKLPEFLSVPWPRDILLQPEPRVLLRNNRGPGHAEFLVGAGLLGMPVRIKEGVNFGVAGGNRGDRLQHGIGAGGGTAVHKEDAIGARLRDYRGFARDAHDEEIVGELDIARRVGDDLRRC